MLWSSEILFIELIPIRTVKQAAPTPVEFNRRGKIRLVQILITGQ